MTVVFTHYALRDLNLIFEYIAKDSPVYAQNQVGRLIKRAEQIGHFPLSGRHVPEIDSPLLREMIEGNYRIIYRVSMDQSRCDVLTIMHTARLLDADKLPPSSSS